ncbi:FIST N-terminal domain-containing protein [Oceanicola sp. 502str15]|uniref:FIST N-terminal domain-containing protein n=1 Tax=Oceanicola sp. 502str15 TaxID=2696061 RepID=UPI0020959B06|nr:FIST N-terminal domain-containing protein [Oceanicola sp. 502str15]MCO6383805.1 GfdT protein [Oceanicola sp. 502str15]
MAVLAEELGPGPFALVCLFASPECRFAELIAGAENFFGEAHVMACTTAGEIGRAGYAEGRVVAVAFPSAAFSATALMMDHLAERDAQSFGARLVRERLALAERAPDRTSVFAFLLVDGLSLKEDILAAALSPALGGVPLFGGSAGDGVDFARTRVALDGVVAQDAAVLALVRTTLPTRVFSLDHLLPTDERMVVTEADPKARIVKSINAEPAAREYARIVGKDPDQLDTFTFAAHPVVVRIGAEHHVRAIQRVTEEGDLQFFSAIDEGMVLTVAEKQDIVAHLDAELGALAEPVAPLGILGCDCLLRRIEAEQAQTVRALSDTLARHRVVGFSTYGEQFGPLHVNQTITGVAFYPPVEAG